MKKLNKKGFTLIELLAVIIVLAVVMLIAVTAVVPQMQKARKQAFITDATAILDAAEEYFAYNEMTNGAYIDCVDIQEALIGKYIEKKGKTDYDGTVSKQNENSYAIALTNGTYYLYATDGDIANLNEDSVVSSAADASAGFLESCGY